MNAENDAVRNQLKRSLAELKVYQIKYPSPYQSNDFPAEDDDKFTAGEGVATISYSYAAPLFEAYDISNVAFSYCHSSISQPHLKGIRELEDLAKQQNSKLDSFKTKALLIQYNQPQDKS